jgi:hypothetical protein
MWFPHLAKRVPFVLFSRYPLSIPHLLCVATWELKLGQEVSSTSSVCTDKSWVSDFSDSVDPGPGSIFVSDHSPLLVGAADDGSGPLLVVPATLEPVLSTGLVSEPASTTVPVSAMLAGSPCLSAYTQLGFGLSKSQIWLLEWIKDRLKINEEVKDEDHLVFLKGMEEDFRWINLVAREQGWLEVNDEDIRLISLVACEEGLVGGR